MRSYENFLVVTRIGKEHLDGVTKKDEMIYDYSEFREFIPYIKKIWEDSNSKDETILINIMHGIGLPESYKYVGSIWYFLTKNVLRSSQIVSESI